MFIVCIDNRTSLDTDRLLYDLTNWFDEAEVIEDKYVTWHEGMKEPGIGLVRNQMLIDFVGYTTLYTSQELEDKSYIFAKSVDLVSTNPIHQRGPEGYKAGLICIIEKNDRVKVVLCIGRNEPFAIELDSPDYETILSCVVDMIGRVQQYEEAGSCAIL